MTSSRLLAYLGAGTAVASLGITALVGNAMAQTATPPATPPAQSAPAAASQNRTNYGNFFLDRLAADLGTTTDKLKSAFTQARNETVDQEVKDGKLTQQQADRIKANPNARPGVGPFGFWRGHAAAPVPGNRGARSGFMGGSQERSAIAQALGITPQDLNSQLRARTLAEIAQGKEQAVKDAIASSLKAQLDQAVKNGRMTQEQENQRLDQIQKLDLSKIGGPATQGRHAPKTPSNQQKPAA